jgi:hypothetical protein
VCRLPSIVCFSLMLFACARSGPIVRADDASVRARPSASAEVPPPDPSLDGGEDANAMRIEIDGSDRIFVDGHMVPGESALATAVSKALFDGRTEAHIYASPKCSAPMVLKVVQVLTREGMKRLAIRSTGKGPVSLTIGGASP